MLYRIDRYWEVESRAPGSNGGGEPERFKGCILKGLHSNSTNLKAQSNICGLQGLCKHSHSTCLLLSVWLTVNQPLSHINPCAAKEIRTKRSRSQA